MLRILQPLLLLASLRTSGDEIRQTHTEAYGDATTGDMS